MEVINQIIRKLNLNKATDTGCISLKVSKASANITDSSSTYIINKEFKTNKYSEDAQTTLVRLIYMKNDRDQIKNYRPASLLNGFSKFYEIFLHDTSSKLTDQIFSRFISA